jgi:hypothetical protein
LTIADCGLGIYFSAYPEADSDTDNETEAETDGMPHLGVSPAADC